MTKAKKVPGWGKALGIIMIICGGFGIFWNIYRLVIPFVFRMQRNFMDEISKHEGDRGFKEVSDVFDTYLEMGKTAENLLMVFSILGIISCIVYIIGGVKLLKAKPQNYNFAKVILLTVLAIAIIQYALMFSYATGFLIVGIMVYSILGSLIDLTLVIILLASDKSAYGLDSAPDNQDYTRSGNEGQL